MSSYAPTGNHFFKDLYEALPEHYRTPASITAPRRVQRNAPPEMCPVCGKELRGHGQIFCCGCLEAVHTAISCSGKFIKDPRKTLCAKCSEVRCGSCLVPILREVSTKCQYCYYNFCEDCIQPLRRRGESADACKICRPLSSSHASSSRDAQLESELEGLRVQHRRRPPPYLGEGEDLAGPAPASGSSAPASGSSARARGSRVGERSFKRHASGSGGKGSKQQRRE